VPAWHTAPIFVVATAKGCRSKDCWTPTAPHEIVEYRVEVCSWPHREHKFGAKFSKSCPLPPAEAMQCTTCGIRSQWASICSPRSAVGRPCHCKAMPLERNKVVSLAPKTVAVAPKLSTWQKSLTCPLSWSFSYRCSIARAARALGWMVWG